MPCDATASAPSALGSAPALELDKTVTLQPHEAAWVNERFADVARRARRSGVDEHPRLEPIDEPRPVYEPTASTDVMLDCLNEVENGGYTDMALSLDYLCRKYEGMSVSRFLNKNYRDAKSRFSLARSDT